MILWLAKVKRRAEREVGNEFLFNGENMKYKRFFKGLIEDALTVAAILFINAFIAFNVSAQQDISDSTGIIGNGRYLGAKTVDGQTTVGVLGIDADGNTRVNANSGEDIVLSVAKTPVARINSTGGISNVTANSPVLISTPVAGTNIFSPGFNLVPPTVTANTAAFLGGATPTPLSEFEIYNPSASTVRAKAAGGATINGATAGGYLTIATKCSVRCKYATATDISCSVPACPTPQGP